MVKATTSKRGLDFTSMTAMARDMQREKCKKVTWLKRDPEINSEVFAVNRSEYPSPRVGAMKQESRTFRTSTFNNKRSSTSQVSNDSRSRSAERRCFYCKKVGHVKS